jgi:hypothetical protein
MREGQIKYTRMVDVYSFGLILYNMISNRLCDVSHKKKVYSIQDFESPHKQTLLKQLALHCLKVEKDERPKME